MSISQVQLRDGEDCDQKAVLLDDSRLPRYYNGINVLRAYG